MYFTYFRLKSEENDWYKCFNQLDEQITVADRSDILNKCFPKQPNI